MGAKSFQIVRVNQIQKAGLKKNETLKPPRKRYTTEPRNTEELHEKLLTMEEPIDEKFKLVFVKDTNATTCYGCGEKFRDSLSSPAPPMPYDVILRRRGFRAYKPRGKKCIKISKDHECVSYHVNKMCVLNKNEDIKPDQIDKKNILHKLKTGHKTHLVSQLQLSFN